jgi:hypothetical protein
MKCPYCNIREMASDDHIFPQFLGGRQTIRTCRECNNRFGHTFEAEVSKDLAPLVVTLRRSGLKPRAYFQWKKAYTDPDTGVVYDLDSNLVFTASTVMQQVDNSKITVVPSERHLRQLEAKLKKEGKPSRIHKSSGTVDINQLTPSIKVGPELRQLALKLSVATAVEIGFATNLLDTTSFEQLNGNPAQVTSVRMDFVTHKEIDDLRPPLGHCVFVKKNGTTGQCFSVVQFFGTIQLYCMLNSSYEGATATGVGVLDNSSAKESFREIEPLLVLTPPRHISQQHFENGVHNWGTRLFSQLRTLFGEEVLAIKIATTAAR